MLDIALHHVQSDGALDRGIICDGLEAAKDEIERLRKALNDPEKAARISHLVLARGTLRSSRRSTERTKP